MLGGAGMRGDGHGGVLRVLLVEGDTDRALRLRRELLGMEPAVHVITATRLQSALGALCDPRIGCVVTDLRLPDAEGAGIVRMLREVRAGVPIVVAASTGTEALAVASIRTGASGYLGRDALPEQLPVLVREALGRSVLADLDDDGSPGPPVPGHPCVATTESMHAVLRLIDRAAASAVPVLVEGETGTGKELVARAVHERGPRARAPFLVQNCAAITESLLESELFGHVRGAFTGAARDRPGLFVEAGDGTVFLDEIAEAPPAVQAKLLRVIQQREVKAVGADRPRRVAARIITATNRRLEEDVGAGRFRPDLYYRVAVFPIRLPPLRYRAADVRPLARHFLGRFAAREGRATGGLAADALGLLERYPWPGNVRELENEMHRLVLCVAPGTRIRRHHLVRRIRDTVDPRPDEPLARVLARVELAIIRQRLQRSRSKSAAARSLGITREALYAKMRRLGMAVR